MPDILDGLQLRCPLSECEAVVMTASGAKVAGAMEKIEEIVGIWATAVADGAEGTFITKAPKVVCPCPTVATAGLPVGNKMYFDASPVGVTPTSSGNTHCGFVTKAAVLGDTTVEINFNGGLT